MACELSTAARGDGLRIATRWGRARVVGGHGADPRNGRRPQPRGILFWGPSSGFEHGNKVRNLRSEVWNRRKIGHRERELEADALCAAPLRLAEPCDRSGPAECCFDAFAHALRGGVAGMAPGAAVNQRAPPLAGRRQGGVASVRAAIRAGIRANDERPVLPQSASNPPSSEISAASTTALITRSRCLLGTRC